MPSTVIGLRENSAGVGDMWLEFKGEVVAGNFRLIHRKVTESWIVYVLQIAHTVFVCLCSTECMLTTEPLTSTEKALMQNETAPKRGATIKTSCNPTTHRQPPRIFCPVFFYLFVTLETADYLDSWCGLKPTQIDNHQGNWDGPWGDSREEQPEVFLRQCLDLLAGRGGALCMVSQVQEQEKINLLISSKGST